MKTLKLITSLFFTFLLGLTTATIAGLPVMPVVGIILGLNIVLEYATKVGAFSSAIFGANYATTVLLDAWAIINDALEGKINQNELRKPFTGALNAFNASTPALIMGGADKLDMMKKSSAQVTKIPVITNLTASDNTARTCGEANAGDSASVTLSYTGYFENFSISRLMMKNNQIDYATALRQGLLNTFRNLHQRLDVAAVAYLESNKSAVNDGSINTFNGPSDTMQVSNANKAQYFASITAEMAENDFNGTLFNVHSVAQMLQQSLQQFEGSGNSNNLAPQQNNFAHYSTNNYSAPSGAQSGSYIFVPGTVGIVGPWIDGLCRDGEDLGTHVWGTIPDPFIPGWVWEIKIKRDCTDSSGTVTGGQRDVVDMFEIGGEFAFTKAYTSTTDTGIYKYLQTTA